MTIIERACIIIIEYSDVNDNINSANDLYYILQYKETSKDVMRILFDNMRYINPPRSGDEVIRDYYFTYLNNILFVFFKFSNPLILKKLDLVIYSHFQGPSKHRFVNYLLREYLNIEEDNYNNLTFELISNYGYYPDNDGIDILYEFLCEVRFSMDKYKHLFEIYLDKGLFPSNEIFNEYIEYDTFREIFEFILEKNINISYTYIIDILLHDDPYLTELLKTYNYIPNENNETIFRAFTEDGKFPLVRQINDLLCGAYYEIVSIGIDNNIIPDNKKCIDEGILLFGEWKDEDNYEIEFNAFDKIYRYLFDHKIYPSQNIINQIIKDDNNVYLYNLFKEYKLI